MLKKTNLINLMIILFLSVIITYEIHKLLNGYILQSRSLTLVVFTVSLIILSFKYWPWNRLSDVALSDNKWIYISILSAIVVISLWGGRNSLPGDYHIHKQYILQLLNGFKYGHLNYSGSPGFYPHLSHTLIAVLSNISYLSVHQCYFICTFVVAFMIPVATYRLAQELNFDTTTSVFFCGMISLFGGFYGNPDFIMQYKYLPAIQIAIPLISRNLSFFIFIIFLQTIIKSLKNNETSKNYLLSCGVLVGIMGNTHPQAFMISMAILSLIILRNIFYKDSNPTIYLSLIIATGIALLYYGPLLFKIMSNNGLIFGSGKGTNEVFPYKLFLIYGPLPVLAIYGIIKHKNMDFLFILSIIFITFLLLLRGLLFIVYPEFELRVVRINRFGPILFLFLAILSSFGIKYIGLSKIKYVVNSIVIVFFLIGYYQTINSLVQWQPKMIKNLAFKPYTPFFNNGVHVFEKIRHIVKDPRKTVMVPVELGRKFARRTGIDVPYAEMHRSNFKKFKENSFSQKKRIELVRRFYDELEQRKINFNILKQFKSENFLTIHHDLESTGKLKLLCEIEYEKQGFNKLYLYELIEPI